MADRRRSGRARGATTALALVVAGGTTALTVLSAIALRPGTRPELSGLFPDAPTPVPVWVPGTDDGVANSVFASFTRASPRAHPQPAGEAPAVAAAPDTTGTRELQAAGGVGAAADTTFATALEGEEPGRKVGRGRPDDVPRAAPAAYVGRHRSQAPYRGRHRAPELPPTSAAA